MNITRDVMEMVAQGMSVDRIRAAIERDYEHYGPSTGP